MENLEEIMTEESSNNTLARFVSRAGSLYSLPAVAMQVLELTNQPKVDATALKACIENDPALTTKILRVVNSSLFGLSREVSELNQALALLGTKPLKLLVLGFSLPERLFAGVESGILGHYWRRTLTKAIAARELCDAHWKQGGDEAFIAGLLGDLGVLVLLKDLGEPYAHFLQKVVDENGDLPALETEALGFEHGELSARLLETWGLPDSLTHAIAAPKSMEELRRLRGSEAQLPQILHLSELLAQLVSERRIGALPDLLEAAKTYRNISRTQITSLVEQLGEKVGQLADVLSLELPDHKEFCDVVTEAHARLSEVAEEAALDLINQAPSESEIAARVLREARALTAAAQAVAQAPLPQVPPSPESTTAGQSSSKLQPSAGKKIIASRTDAPAGNAFTAKVVDSVAKVADDPECDTMLLDAVTKAVQHCSQSRIELTMLLFEIDRIEQVVAEYGSEVTRTLGLVLDAVFRVWDHTDKQIVRTDEVRQAVILPKCDRRQGLEHANHLQRTVRKLLEHQFSEGSIPITVSIGAASVAIPRKTFPPTDLIEAAERCLYAAHTGGGNAIKSIEIY